MTQKDDFKKWQTDIKIAMIDEIIEIFIMSFTGNTFTAYLHSILYTFY